MEETLKQKILDKTDNGLDILKDLYPGLTDENGEVRKMFKIRQEKTPSAEVYQNKAGEWCVVDYGDDGRGRNAIDAWMEDKNMDPRNPSLFVTACQLLAAEYGVAEVLSKDVNKSRVVEREARPDEKEGEVCYELRDFTEPELRLLGPGVTKETCERLGYYCLEWYGRVKDRKIKEWHSDPQAFPIFMRECTVADSDNKPVGKFFKIYKHKEPAKRWSFMSLTEGSIPEDYVHGFYEMRRFHQQLNQKKLDETEEEKDEKKRWKTQPLSRIHKEYDRGTDRYYKVVMCSGERDALCVAARGDIPIWFNSETKPISTKVYLQILRYAGEIYNIPDLDRTGVEQGARKALTFPDLRTVWLPSWLGERKDMRLRGCKDFRDWCGLNPLKTDYYDLMDKAAPVKFWTQQTNDKTGKVQFQIDSTALHNFLRLHGFYRLKDDTQEDPQYIRLVGPVAVRKRPRDIRDFVRLWTQDEQDPDQPGKRIRQSSNVAVSNGVRNLVLNDAKLSPAYLSALAETDPDFTNAGARWQRIFFRNGVATVTHDGTLFCKWKEYTGDTVCWQQNVIQHDYKEMKPMFEIKRLTDIEGTPATYDDGTPAYDIRIDDCRSSKFFGYLINSSRLYWRKEMEKSFDDDEQRRAYRELHPFEIDSDRLSIGERRDQKRCLVNKIFAIGYMMHTFKSPSRPWALYAMDNRIAEDTQSNGRSGKSFFFKCFEEVMQMSVTKLSGKNDHLTDSDFIFERVDRSTQIVQVDDLSKRVTAESFYDSLSGDLVINAKNVKSFVIPFLKSPKFAFTTNFVPASFDPSSEGRLLYMVFGDYYHQRTPEDDQDYRETRSIFDDFGKNLFGSDYSDDEWNADQNFLLQCLQFYLSICHKPEKLQPPMQNIIQRNLISRMGPLRDWAEKYFAYRGPNVDRMVPTEEAYNDFIRETKAQNWKPNTFSKRLGDFAKYCPWILEKNPKDKCNSQGRVFDTTRTVKNAAGNDVNPECYYMRTVPDYKPLLDEEAAQAVSRQSKQKTGHEELDFLTDENGEPMAF
ncbi:MAG: hypothetical protein IJ868_00650 [Prevotella sp.]|nr:hypothetical protein [Prevotella sp.]